MKSNIPDYFGENDLEDFGEFLMRRPGLFLVVLDEKAGIVACGGIALGKKEPTEAILCYGMVENSRLRLGIGKELFRRRLELFLPQEPQVTVVKVNTSQRTEGFFQKLGFLVIEREPNGYGLGLDRVGLAIRKHEFVRFLDGVSA